MIWLAISAYALVAMFFVLAMSRAASRADNAGEHMTRIARRRGTVTETDDSTEQGA